MTNYDYVDNVHKMSMFEADKIATQMKTEEMIF